MGLEPINGDTRFYPGWGWISSESDCRRGNCCRGTTREQVIDDFLDYYRRQHWPLGRSLTLYVMMSPGDAVTTHHVVI